MKKNTRTLNRFTVDQTLATTVQTRIASLVNRRGSWQGTMSELSAAITTRGVPSNWPKTPSVMRRVVNAVLPSLRKAGVRVSFGRTSDHMRTRFASFTVRG